MIEAIRRNLASLFCGRILDGKAVSPKFLYSVRGLERSELGGSHGWPGRLWDRFL